MTLFDGIIGHPASPRSSGLRRHRGFALVQAVLALAVISAAVGLGVQRWGSDLQMRSVQRQAELLQSARLAAQRLVSIYRNQLVVSSGGVTPQLLVAIDGTPLNYPPPYLSAIGPSSTDVSGVTTALWRLSGSDLINLKLLPAGYPIEGVYSGLAGATLQLDLTATYTPASASATASALSSNQVKGTLCYTRPMMREGQLVDSF
jgi:hypothetical protein